ncbi:hypothetical protein KLEP7_gp133 [Pseudaeromonas phage vB_PpeM_ KLEP7]|nr:hypothetical protein KLEP7_gp133 [Pseudaeromonas phage vB_PpeM_ KLEP7]
MNLNIFVILFNQNNKEQQLC